MWTLDASAGRALITNEIEAPRLEHDLGVRQLGWELIAVPWFAPEAMLDAACDFANVAPKDLLSERDDIGVNVRDELIAQRLSLSEPEIDELRELGELVGMALGRGIDEWRPSVTRDFDVAALIAEHLETHGAKPVCLIVGGDERLRRFRHPLAIGDVVHDALMAVVVARRAGLHVAATRLVVRRHDDDIATLMPSLNPVNDAILDASRSNGTWGESYEALGAAYDTAGFAGAWREHFQGGPIGFEQREFELAPGQFHSPFWKLPREAKTAVAWNPSLRGGAKIEDTYLVGDELELLSATPEWPLEPCGGGTSRSALRVLP